MMAKSETSPASYGMKAKPGKISRIIPTKLGKPHSDFVAEGHLQLQQYWKEQYHSSWMLLLLLLLLLMKCVWML